jgi:hypothetical protein
MLLRRVRHHPCDCKAVLLLRAEAAQTHASCRHPESESVTMWACADTAAVILHQGCMRTRHHAEACMQQKETTV